jgi:hypothetical protein
MTVSLVMGVGGLVAAAMLVLLPRTPRRDAQHPASDERSGNRF